MKRIVEFIFVAVLSCTSALAQSENPYNGKWTATWAGTKGLVKGQNKGDVVILDSGGSFQNQKISSKNPCVGKKAPIAVKTATADELVFVIQFSTVLRGCQDSEVKLKRVDDNTLKGIRDADKEITLVKE
jgi:hypothetical protein